MEKLDKPQRKEYAPLIAWAGDIEEILSELNVCRDVTLIADDVKYESVQEFIQERRGCRPKAVEISAHNPHVSIKLSQHWASMYVSSSELKASGLFLRIDTILRKCERKPRFLYRRIWIIISVVVIPNLTHITLLRSYGNIWISSLLITGPWFLYTMFIEIRCFSLVQPMHQENKPGFFKRNGDAIILSVVSAMIGAGLAKAVEKFWPSSPSPASTTTPVPTSISTPAPATPPKAPTPTPPPATP